MKKENIIQTLWKSIKAVLFLPFWWSQKRIKRDPNQWIFGAWFGTRYADNSRAFFEYVVANHPEIKAYWVTKNNDVYQDLKRKSLPVVLADSKEGKNIQKHASIFFLTVGPLDVNSAYLNGCRIVWLWHGMILKFVGEPGRQFLMERTIWKKIKTKIRRIILPYEFLTPYDGYPAQMLSTSPFFSKYLQPSFKLAPQDIWELGQPRNDKLFFPSTEPFILDLKKKFNNPQLVLYMPTFRDEGSKKNLYFNPFNAAGFDLDTFTKTLCDNNIVFIYKGHYFDSENSMLSQDNRIITVSDNDYDDLYTFVKDVDVLITDYSSIYFDFLLCRKPIILFPFDKDRYMAKSRPFYYDYELLQAKRVYSWQELTTALAEKDYYVPSEDTIKLFNTYTDGHSCQRIFDKIIQKID